MIKSGLKVKIKKDIINTYKGKKIIIAKANEIVEVISNRGNVTIVSDKDNNKYTVQTDNLDILK